MFIQKEFLLQVMHCIFLESRLGNENPFKYNKGNLNNMWYIFFIKMQRCNHSMSDFSIAKSVLF